MSFAALTRNVGIERCSGSAINREYPIRFCILTSALCILTSSALGAWDPPVRLTFSDSASHTSFNNVHCLAGFGYTLHLVWYDHRAGVDQIFYKRSTDLGTTWSADTQLTNASGIKSDPSIAATGSDLQLVWEDGRNGYNSEVYHLRSTDNGATWGPESRLTNDNYMSRNPCVSAQDSLVHVAWASDTAGREVYYMRSTDRGVTWVDRRRLTFDMQESWNPSLTAADSVVHLAWRDWRDHSFEVYYLRSTDYGATWDTAATRLSGDLTTGSYNPCIAASGPAAHVIWWDCRHMPYELYYRRTTDYGNTWEMEGRLTTDTTGTYNPSITASGPNVHVAWEALYGTSFAMYKHSTDVGATWSPDTALTVAPAYWSVSPCIAVLGDGVHMVWTDFRDSEYGEVYYMRNLVGSAVLEERSMPYTLRPTPGATICRGVLHLGAVGSRQYTAYRTSLLDISGRDVMDLHPGPNDVRHLRSGVYFVAVGGERSAVSTQKVIIAR